MGIVVLGAVFVDIKGYPSDLYIPGGRNSGRVEVVHGGVSRNLAEDIANVELRPTFVSLVDDTGTGADVVRKLRAHKVNTDYIRTVPHGRVKELHVIAVRNVAIKIFADTLAVAHFAEDPPIRGGNTLHRADGAVGRKGRVHSGYTRKVHILRCDLAVVRKAAHHGLGGKEASLPVGDRHRVDLAHLRTRQPR